MSNPFFSVIVPAHNAENHIQPLLDSVSAQSFQDYELIVVCDNCEDNTFNIACQYVRPDTNDRVWCVEYGRDGLARDKGLKYANGAWVLFADDDDWFIGDHCFDNLANFISTQDDTVDLVAFGYDCRTRGYIKPVHENVFKPRIDHVWSSAWRRDRIGTARFGDAVFCSDTYFLRDMKSRVRNIAIYDAPLYYYNFLRPGSQTDLFCKGKLRQSPVAE